MLFFAEIVATLMSLIMAAKISARTQQRHGGVRVHPYRRLSNKQRMALVRAHAKENATYVGTEEEAEGLAAPEEDYSEDEGEEDLEMDYANDPELLWIDHLTDQYVEKQVLPLYVFL